MDSAEFRLVIRGNIRDTLDLWGSAEQQLRYESNVPHVYVPLEMFHWWFDDYYHPDSPDWVAFFSAAEVEAMSNFNGVLDSDDATLEAALASGASVARLQELPIWRALMEAARTAREAFSGDERGGVEDSG